MSKKLTKTITQVDNVAFKGAIMDLPLERISEGPHKARLMALIDQVAALSVSGLDRKGVAAELKIDDESVDKILHRPDTIDKMRKIGESAIATAKTKFRRKIIGLQDEVYKVIEYQLKEKKSLHAAALVLKSMGLDSEDPSKEEKATSMTVILPGGLNTSTQKVKITEKK